MIILSCSSTVVPNLVTISLLWAGFLDRVFSDRRLVFRIDGSISDDAFSCKNVPLG